MESTLIVLLEKMFPSTLLVPSASITNAEVCHVIELNSNVLPVMTLALPSQKTQANEAQVIEK